MDVAGLVMGALPIAIKVYTVYQNIATPKYSETMNDFLRQLHLAHSRLRNCMEKLLSGLVEDSFLQELLENPKIESWSSLALESKIISRLDNSYSGYVETWKIIQKSLLRIEKLVGLDDRNSKVSRLRTL
jgi:hypothetical protein